MCSAALENASIHGASTLVLLAVMLKLCDDVGVKQQGIVNAVQMVQRSRSVDEALFRLPSI